MAGGNINSPEQEEHQDQQLDKFHIFYYRAIGFLGFERYLLQDKNETQKDATDVTELEQFARTFPPIPENSLQNLDWQKRQQQIKNWATNYLPRYKEADSTSRTEATSFLQSLRPERQLEFLEEIGKIDKNSPDWIIVVDIFDRFALPRQNDSPEKVIKAQQTLFRYFPHSPHIPEELKKKFSLPDEDEQNFYRKIDKDVTSAIVLETILTIKQPTQETIPTVIKILKKAKKGQVTLPSNPRASEILSNFKNKEILKLLETLHKRFPKWSEKQINWKEKK